MSYEGPSLANQNKQKLGVFGRKLEGSHFPFFFVILINIRGNAIIMFKSCLIHLDMKYVGIRIISNNHEIIN